MSIWDEKIAEGGEVVFGENRIRRKAVALAGIIIGVLMLLLSH